MFTFYDLEVFKHDWLGVFERDGDIIRIHNDRGALERLLSQTQILVGYNNYGYDDKVLASILRKLNPYDVSQKIITGKPFNLKLNSPLTLDVMQEARQGLSLKEAQANMGLDIVETPINFDLDRKLTSSEIEQVFQYCENDVLTTKELFEKRESYFTSKLELVKEFKLAANEVKKSRAQLSASILRAKKRKNAETDRLKIEFDRRLYDNSIPQGLFDFYTNMRKKAEAGEDPQKLEKEKITYTICGIEHQYGLGGLHGAKENYFGTGKYMQIDVSSFYPSLMINCGFVSRAAEKPELYKKIYDERLRLKKAGDPKQEIYKIVLNATFGASKSKWNPLYDPKQFNNIVVHGQLILTHLIIVLKPYIELIQSNTDGIIIKYENEELIRGMVQDFGDFWGLNFDVDLISKIAQRDVNNYVIQYQDGKIKAKGRFANFNGGDYERNSLTIIDKALVDYYMHGKRINQTVVECWKRNELDRFQLVAKAGKYDGMAQEIREPTLFDGTYTSRFKELQKVNRIFATKDKRLGGVYKTRHSGETKYSKVPYTSENCLVWNDDLSKLDKRKIDLNWYIKEIEKWIF